MSNLDEGLTGRAAERREQRRRRTRDSRNAGVDLNLGIDEIAKDPNYVYGWKNDEKGGIYNATVRDDWEFVTDETMASDNRNLSESDKRIRRHVGSKFDNTPLYAYLLRKWRDWYDKDIRESAQRAIDERAQITVKQHAETGEGKSLDPGTTYIPRNVEHAIQETEARDPVIRRARK